MVRCSAKIPKCRRFKSAIANTSFNCAPIDLLSRLCFSTRTGVGTNNNSNMASTANPAVNQNKPDMPTEATIIGPKANDNIMEVAMVKPMVAMALVRCCSRVTSASSAIITPDTAPLPANARPIITP